MDRKWSVVRWQDDEGWEPEEEFRARVRAKLMDAEAVGDMIGGAFNCRPQREEVQSGVWVTMAWHIMWVSEGAARRATGEFDRKPAHPDPERNLPPEPEPVGVGVEESGE